MDRSSFGDRLGVFLIEVLTKISYQILMSD